MAFLNKIEWLWNALKKDDCINDFVKLQIALKYDKCNDNQKKNTADLKFFLHPEDLIEIKANFSEGKKTNV